MPAVSPAIFKAYDVRGLYGSEIDGDVAEAVGRAFARVIGDLAGKPPSTLRLGLGRDMRLSAPELAARYCEGMVAEGARVLDAGMVGTEMLYFLVGSQDLDGGLMCTASHNPKAYTGAKLVERGALALSGDRGIQDIRRVVEAGLGTPDPSRRGSAEQVDVGEAFRAAVWALIDPGAVKPLKVVLDGGNGMAGPMAGPLLERLPLELCPFYWEPDGAFPDHEPNPLLPENRAFVMRAVVEHGADLGIAWDGDADRCFFIDERGEFVDGDFLTALLAESVLAKHPGADILYDVRASRAVPDTVARAGGRAHVNRVGHAFFKTRMREEGGVFGGEVSGHYYFADFFNADSGTIPALLVLELVSRRGATLGELVDAYRSRYFISGEVNSEVADPHAKVEDIAARYADGRITRLDGVSVDYDDWHFNVRPSNTEPLLRLNLESLVSRADMEARRDELLGLIPLMTAPPPFALERFFARHEFAVEVNACASDVEAPSMAEVLAWGSEETRTAWESLALGYTQAPGHPRLRAAIAGLYDRLGPEDVLVFCGAEEAIFAFAHTELAAGDHAVVLWPAYQSLHEIARATGAEVTLLELRHEDGWALDLDRVRAALRPGRTRAVVVNFPHNPTGATIEPGEFETLCALVEDAGARLFSDEVYRWCEHDGRSPLPAAAERSGTALSLGVMSKTFALPGLRIGWVASRDRALLDRLAAFKDYTTICCSAPSELLATAALESVDAVVARTRSIVEPNLALLDDFFARHAGVLEWARPRGAPIGFPRVVDGRGVQGFADELLERASTLILPGLVYGHGGEHFRLGFGRRDLPEALRRMDAIL